MGNERISIAGRGAEVLHDSKLVRCPHSLDPTLVTSPVRLGPSMSLIPFAPFSKLSQRGLEVFALSDLSLLTSGYAALRSLSAVRTDSTWRAPCSPAPSFGLTR